MYDTASEHAPAIAAAILLLAVLWLIPRTLSMLANRGIRWAVAPVALGLVLRLGPPGRRTWPRRVWRAVAFPMLVSLTTVGIWVGGLVHPDALHAHPGALLQPVATEATPDQREAAARLITDTRA